MSQFPNRATMWPKGVSANPGGKPKGGRVVQRKRRALQQAAAVAEIINEDRPKFTGDGVDLLVSIYQDATMPLEVRLVCAREAARYERSQRSPTEYDPRERPPSGMRIDMTMLTPEQLDVLLAITQSGAIKPAGDGGNKVGADLVRNRDR